MEDFQQFVIRENIDRFAQLLTSEANPLKRITLSRLLVDEEDKLGRHLERLAMVEKCIREVKEKIARQRALIATLHSETDSLGLAMALLGSLQDTQAMLHDYRGRVNGEIERSTF
jgi:hypothetical protein